MYKTEDNILMTVPEGEKSAGLSLYGVWPEEVPRDKIEYKIEY